MAKNMAIVNNGKVVNIACFPDWQKESESIKDMHEKDVIIGDDYENGNFYRDGKIVLSIFGQLEIAQAELEKADDQRMELLDIIENLILEG